MPETILSATKEPGHEPVDLAGRYRTSILVHLVAVGPVVAHLE